MVQLAIRCQPRVPVSTDEVEVWLERQVGKLRAEAPQATIRLSRLTQGLPSAIGWLIELQLADEAPLLADDRLDDSLRDMRLLGLQPTLLAPARGKDRAGADANSSKPSAWSGWRDKDKRGS